jgi:hypothetical protein
MIDLAVKGLIRIDEKKENLLGLFNKETYTIVRLKVATGLPKEEHELYTRLFTQCPKALFSTAPTTRACKAWLRVQEHIDHPVEHLPQQRQQREVLADPDPHPCRLCHRSVVLANMFWGDHDAVYIVVFVVANLILSHPLHLPHQKAQP